MIAYVALGGNLGTDAEIARRFAGAVDAIRQWPEAPTVRVSSIYRSDAEGPVADQPRFLNAVIAVELDLDPRELLQRLHDIEDKHGRDRAAVADKGPRTLDLDLLLCGKRVIESAELSLPHPQMHQRGFVLAPLVELAGRELPIPGHGTAGELLDAVAVAPEHAGEIAAVAVDHD